MVLRLLKGRSTIFNPSFESILANMSGVYMSTKFMKLFRNSFSKSENFPKQSTLDAKIFLILSCQKP